MSSWPQVPHGDGALAVHVLPRYVLHNTLDVALQYKQQGAGGERELPPAAPRAVQWPNATLPLRLCLRVQASRRPGMIMSNTVSSSAAFTGMMAIMCNCPGITVDLQCKM